MSCAIFGKIFVAKQTEHCVGVKSWTAVDTHFSPIVKSCCTEILFHIKSLAPAPICLHSFEMLKSILHCSLSAVTHAPFHASMPRPASQAGPMHEAAGGKLVNAALLSLINEACVNVCCATLLSSKLVGPACVQARSCNPRGRACKPNGKGSGEDGILNDVVPVYLYCPAFSVSVFLSV